jgi:hypothetical protein
LTKLNVGITQQLYWLIEEFKSGFSHNFNTFTNEIFNECETTPQDAYKEVQESIELTTKAPQVLPMFAQTQNIKRVTIDSAEHTMFGVESYND